MTRRSFWTYCLAGLMLFPSAGAADTGVYSPNEYYEYLIGSTVWQLSAESQALMRQAFAAAKGQIDAMARKCLDPGEEDWIYGQGAAGERIMLYRGRRVAVISDIDDTLVDGVHYTADIVGKDGDINNAAFARFVLSEGCTALPGAAEFVRHCVDSGAAFYYITNRYDQGYRINQSDSMGSYAASIAADGRGLYRALDDTEIGSTIYQVLGKSFYDITLESMTRLGFPIDDQHLIMNDGRLYGESKERARAAIREGAADYPNGQRADGNCTRSALTLSCEPHCVAMLLGDQLGDFTDDFSAEGLDAVSRAKLTGRYAGKWGAEWIVLPNAVYGSAMNYATKYDIPALLHHYAYTSNIAK